VEFTTTIGLGGKSSNHLKTKKIKSWKWRGICENYKKPISKSDVRHTSFKNRRKNYKAQVLSTIRGGKEWSMDWWFVKKVWC
jgi:hypothetical protein